MAEGHMHSLVRIEIDNLPEKQGLNLTSKKKITPK